MQKQKSRCNNDKPDIVKCKSSCDYKCFDRKYQGSVSYKHKVVSVLRVKRLTRLSRVSNPKGLRRLDKYNWIEHCGRGKVLECTEEVIQRYKRKKISRGYKRKMRRGI